MDSPAPASRLARNAEALAAVGLLFAGLLPRLGFALAFPTLPVSDFAGLVDMGVRLTASLFAPGTGWDFYSPGLPTALSRLFHALPGSPADIARLATAVAMGLVPLLPLFMLRPQVSLRARLLAGGLLALWPGQILFSGVVAQDNWALPPTVALACLAVRVLLEREPRPISAALLLALGAFVRQEMLVVLLPLSLVAAGLGTVPARRLLKPGLRWGLTLAVLLLAFAGQRWRATGRFALTTEHAGISVLGAYMPGAAAPYWAGPRPYVAALAPEVLADPSRAPERMRALALDEFARRPGFHLLRMGSGALHSASRVDSANLRWSLGAEAMPASLQAKAQKLSRAARGPLDVLLAVLHLLFLAALAVAIQRRAWPVLLLAVPVALKLGVHAALVTQPRYYVPTIALELLAIALASGAAAALDRRRRIQAALAGALTLGVLAGSATLARAYVLAHDFDPRPSYLLSESAGGTLRCTVEGGQLALWDADTAVLDLSAGARSPAALTCLASAREAPLALELRSPCTGSCRPALATLNASFDGAPRFTAPVASLANASRLPLASSGSSALRLSLAGAGAERRGDARVVLRLVSQAGGAPEPANPSAPR